MGLKYIWTDGDNETFKKFYLITEDYYSSIVGGKVKRQGFVPYNISSSIEDVLLVYSGETPAACSGLKRYSDTDVEIKRVWVVPEFRGQHIAIEMMDRLEEKSKLWVLSE